MDGSRMNDADHQDAVTSSEKRLAVAENGMRDVLVTMLKAGRPFSDPDANAEFEDCTRELSERYFAHLSWHRRVRRLVGDNLSGVQFGGDK